LLLLLLLLSLLPLSFRNHHPSDRDSSRQQAAGSRQQTSFVGVAAGSSAYALCLCSACVWNVVACCKTKNSKRRDNNFVTRYNFDFEQELLYSSVLLPSAFRSLMSIGCLLSCAPWVLFKASTRMCRLLLSASNLAEFVLYH
jgi:hypothetical protein